MGLADCQKLQARLYTDADWRARFFADPRALGADFGLSAEEVDRLAQLSEFQVGRFADSLRHKRRNDVGKLLPLTRRVLGEARFAALWDRHGAAHGPNGGKGLRAGAIAFAIALEPEVRRGEIRSPWMADLLRYEAARLVAADPTRRWTVRYFHHPIADLVRAVHARPGVPPPTKPTLAIWFRASRAGRLRHLVLSLPSRSRIIGWLGSSHRRALSQFAL